MSETSKSHRTLVAFFTVIEKSFWVIAAIVTIIGAFGMLLKGGHHIYEDFASLKDILKYELFYAIICFELFQMARIRIMGESHAMVLYHFVFMAALTLGREIFLIHNLDIFVIIGFSVMIGVYIVFYAWSHHRPLWLTKTPENTEKQS